MKHFITLLTAFVVFVASTLPCEDRDSFAHISITQQQQFSESNPDTHGQGRFDVCGPFCSCSCCGALQFSKKTAAYEFVVLPPAGSFVNSFLPGAITTLALPIWQPPQLAA